LIYRTAVVGGDLKLLATIANNVATGYLDVIADGALGAKDTLGVGANMAVGTYQYKVAYVTSGLPDDPVVFPAFSAAFPFPCPQWRISTLGAVGSVVTTAGNQSVHLASVPTIGGLGGLSGLVGRRIYRTKVNGTEFFYLTTIQENTTTVYEDNTKDGDLETAEIPGLFVKNMNMRNLVVTLAGCEAYSIITALPRHWPARGRYTVALKAKATDGAAFTTTSGATSTTLALPIFEDAQVGDWAWDNIERIRYFKPVPRGTNVTKGTAAFPEAELPLKRFYAPDTPTKRYQMALFIMRAKGIVTKDLNTTQRFVDVWPGYGGEADDEPFYTDINALYDLGISVGCAYNPSTGQRYFCPQGYVTRAEMVTFLLRALGAG